MTLTDIIEFVARTAYVTGVGDTPPAIAMRHVPGTSRLCLVLGPNASGKALVREFLAVDPHVVFMGDENAASLDEWLARDEEPLDIEALPRRSSSTYTRVAAIRRALGLRD